VPPKQPSSHMNIVCAVGREVDSMFSESWASSLAGGPDKYSIRLRMLTMRYVVVSISKITYSYVLLHYY
jgi:hypothetical protein